MDIQLATLDELRKEQERLEEEFRAVQTSVSDKWTEIKTFVLDAQEKMKELSEQNTLINKEINKREGRGERS